MGVFVWALAMLMKATGQGVAPFRDFMTLLCGGSMFAALWGLFIGVAACAFAGLIRLANCLGYGSAA
ncbi:MAG: hypothetical protein JNK82_09745 [Myxococcaceae bacterium]|nr:hypothetical protein [Myxococcaceae bacterium]